MRSLVLLFALLGVFAVVLWHPREPEAPGSPGPDTAARVHTVDLADTPTFQESAPAGPQPLEAPEPAGEAAPVPEREEAGALEALGPESESGATPPTPSEEPEALLASFDPDRSAQLVRRLLSVYARLRGEDLEAAGP